MKRIEKIEMVLNGTLNRDSVKCGWTFFEGYRSSVEAKCDYLNIDNISHDSNVMGLVGDCVGHQIDTITISDNATHLIDTLAEFERCGCEYRGLTKVDTPWKKNVHAIRLKMPTAEKWCVIMEEQLCKYEKRIKENCTSHEIYNMVNWLRIIYANGLGGLDIDRITNLVVSILTHPACNSDTLYCFACMLDDISAEADMIINHKNVCPIVINKLVDLAIEIEDYDFLEQILNHKRMTKNSLVTIKNNCKSQAIVNLATELLNK